MITTDTRTDPYGEAAAMARHGAEIDTRIAAGQIGFTELCREYGIPARDIVKLTRAIGIRRRHGAVVAVLTVELPPSLRAAADIFASAWRRDVGAVDGASYAEAAE